MTMDIICVIYTVITIGELLHRAKICCGYCWRNVYILNYMFLGKLNLHSDLQLFKDSKEFIDKCIIIIRVSHQKQYNA